MGGLILSIEYFINFLVCYPKGVIFICSVDASDLVKETITLSNFFNEIVTCVGLSNTVHWVI